MCAWRDFYEAPHGIAIAPYMRSWATSESSSYFLLYGDMYLAFHIEIFPIHCAASYFEIHNLAGAFSRRAAGHLHCRCARVCASVCASVCGKFRACARVRKSWSVRTFVCTYVNLQFYFSFQCDPLEMHIIRVRDQNSASYSSVAELFIS